jgi:hypothetical protein
MKVHRFRCEGEFACSVDPQRRFAACSAGAAGLEIDSKKADDHLSLPSSAGDCIFAMA